jgi:hypothetical protein
MSFNRLMYDEDTTHFKLLEKTGSLGYLLLPDKYYNVNDCRINRGLVGGNNVSKIEGNLVDLESDLFGVTRKASLAPNNHYLSPCSIGDLNNCKASNILIKGNPSTEERVIDTNLKSLDECSIINYKPNVLPEPLKLGGCSK